MPVITEGEIHRGLVETAAERDNDFRFTWAIEAATPPNQELLGGKGAGLVEMKSIGLLVPPGFILTTEACQAYYEAGDNLPEPIWNEVHDQIRVLQEKTDLIFGDPSRPLVVSGRGGARKSMPGILTSVLNIGLNRNTVQGLAGLESEWCAWDSLLRAHQSYGVDVKNMNPDDFNEIIDSLQQKHGVEVRQKLPVEALKEAVAKYETIVALPQNPYDHLREAIEAVFKSWNGPEAIAYREEHNIPHDWGTAANIVQMIFGNKPQDGFAGTGVLFTHHPDTGENKPYVAYITGAQGTDIVGPESVHQLVPLDELPSAVSKPLRDGCQILAQNYPHPQESEWAHNGGDVYWLQTRAACLSRRAELEISFEPWREQVRKKVMSMDEAASHFLEKIDLTDLGPSEVLQPHMVSVAQNDGRVFQGIPISPGIGIGVAVDNLKTAEALNALEEPVSAILLLESPAHLDLANLPSNVVGGITHLGGAGSHEAQKYRQSGFPLVFGTKDFKQLSPGTQISLDATNGLIIIGQPIPVIKQHTHLPAEVAQYLEKLQEKLEANPWLGLTYFTEDRKYWWQGLVQKAIETLERLKTKWQSPKAQAIGLIAEMIPAEERLDYIIFPQDDIDTIRTVLHERFDKEHDVSLRTCHSPESRMGTAPYQAFNRSEQIDEFFDSQDFEGRFGSYSQWQRDEALSEVVVGCFPKSKLDEKLAEQHCVFTVSATVGGIIIQIIPHTPLLRDLDTIKPEEIITIRMPVNPQSSIKLGKISVQIGENIEDDPLSEQFAKLVMKTVFGRWWKPPFALPNLMAALTEVEDINTIEGQARIYLDEKGAPSGESWGGLVYGVKGRKT